MIIKSIHEDDLAKDLKKFRLLRNRDYIGWYHPNGRDYYTEDDGYDPDDELLRIEFINTKKMTDKHLLVLRLKYQVL